MKESKNKPFHKGFAWFSGNKALKNIFYNFSWRKNGENNKILRLHPRSSKIPNYYSNFVIKLIFFDLEDVLHPEFFEEVFHYDGGSANTNS